MLNKIIVELCYNNDCSVSHALKIPIIAIDMYLQHDARQDDGITYTRASPDLNICTNGHVRSNLYGQ